MLRVRYFLLLLLTFLSAHSFNVEAQVSKFQALYLLQFAKNVGWPEQGGAELIISVIGDRSLAQELKSIAEGKSVGSRKVIVRDDISTTGIERADMIYLGESKSSQINNLIGAQEGNTVLIVSGTKGQCSNGAGIAFNNDGGKLNYEICEDNIKKHGLHVTTKLTSLGKQVR